MPHQEYNTVNNFSVSSFDFDGSEDELSEEEYYKNFRNFRPASGSRIFQRWLLNIIDIPNNLTNRLRDWLRPTNGGSMIDKSSGTNSITSRIRLSKGNEKFQNSAKNNHRYLNTHAARNLQEAFDDHRYLKNHHVYHVYKQNEMGIERVVREQHNYSTSYLQRNGRFSSSPVLVLPRINPDTGLPIFQPQSQHSRTTTERRSIKHKEEKLRSEGRRNARILRYEENHYTHLRGDSKLIERFPEKQNAEKTLSAVNKNCKQFNHNQDNDSEEAKLANLNEISPKIVRTFPRKISLQVEIKKPQSLFETLQNKDLDIIKNEEKVKTENTNLEGFSAPQNISTVTQKNVDALLNNLRQKINSFNAEKQTNRPVVHLSRVIDPDTGSQDRDHLFGARWQDKSGLFTRAIKPAYTEARASFTERIQDIWTQEKSSSQWAILHNHKNIIYGTKRGIKREEDVKEEKEIIISDTTTNEIRKNIINNEMAKPTVCDVGVQYSNSKSLNLDESLRISSSKYIPTVKNNENKLGMQIPQISEAFTEPKVILNSIQLPTQEQSQTFLQHEISGVANDLINPKSVVLPESKATVERPSLDDQNVQKTLSDDTNDPMNINAEDLQFAFSTQKIKADVQYEIPETISTERLEPSKEKCPRNSPTFLNVSSQNINNKNSQLTVQRQEKKLCCPFKGSLKNPVVLLETKSITKSSSPTEQNVQGTFSPDTNNCMKINTENSQFPFPPQKNEAEVQCKIPEIITTKVHDLLEEQSPQNSRTFLSVSPQNINNKKSQFPFHRQRKRLHCPFKSLRKKRSSPTPHFSRSSLRNSRKSRIFTYRFPKKVGLWLSNKFHSASRQNSPISGCSSRTLPSTKPSKLTLTMRSIFKCIEKTSEVNVPQGSMNKACQIPTIFQSNERPMPVIRPKKHEAQSSMVKNENVTSKDQGNTANVIIDTKSIGMVTADFSAIEPAMSDNRRTPSKRSMTTLSVTTSNSTNIPLQLLGSTSDTNIVPSNDSQDDFKRQVDQSNTTEIITRNRAIETCEETDHYNSDSLLPEGTTEVNENPEKLDYSDSKKINNLKTCHKTNYGNFDPFLPKCPEEVNVKFKKIESDDNKRIKHFETSEETDNLISDLLFPEEDKKIEKSEYDKSRKIIKCSNKVKTDQKSVTNFSSVNVERKLKIEEKTRQVDLIRKPQEHNSLIQKRRRENVLINANIDGKRSFDMHNFSTERNEYSKMKTTVSDKNAVDRNAQKLRLNRRKSRIDMIVDKSPREEYKGKRAEIRNVHNKKLERRESRLNIGADDFSNDAARLKSRDSQEPYHRKISSTELESQNSARKLRQREDSPMIPRRAIDLQKRRSIAAGKSSLIPVGIGNSRCISKTIKNSADDSCNKTKFDKNKNQISAIDSSLTSRPSLKKTLRNSSGVKEKKNINYRVRFELKKKSSEEVDFGVNNDRKKDISYSGNLGIDEKRIIRKIKSSLENGEPLKRIKITEPGLISKRTAKSSALKFEVEKDVIDQPRETCSSNQNLSRRERMSLISGVDNENVYLTYPHRESTLSEQIPKARGSFEKRHHNESEISYRSHLIEKKKNNYGSSCPVKQTNEALPQFGKSEKTESLREQSIIDFARIKEQVENEILEQTSRSSGTEDCDCAIVLIKAINSSMELSDA